MRLRHLIHRHEPPVPADPVAVVAITPDVVAVCKPHGMPVHVSGQYRKNTVLGLLSALSPELGPLFPVHRLDKPVSGLLLFARGPAAADTLRQLMERHDLEKVYVARVHGAFPPGLVNADVALRWDPRVNCAYPVPDFAGTGAGEAERLEGAHVEREEPAGGGEEGRKEEEGRGMEEEEESKEATEREGEGEMEISEGPIRQARKRRKRDDKARRATARIARRAGLANAAAGLDPRAATRTARTDFRLLAVAPDGQTSLVECRPRTGRTHQIRVHLQYLGHPIANDRQYGGRYHGPLSTRELADCLGVSWNASSNDGSTATGTGTTAGEVCFPGATAADSAPAAVNRNTAKDCDGGNAMALPVPAPTPADVALPTYSAPTDTSSIVDFCGSEAFMAPPDRRDSSCPNCPYCAPRDCPVDLRPLWLHARRYGSIKSEEEGGWAFEAPLPGWADENWTPVPP
jgi:23S rRNA-/tRNA-specific pseudouridylate synthase